METSATEFFDPNQYYRIINLAQGAGLSLDVDTPQTTEPNGTLGLRTSGPFSGQIWQFLESSDQSGHFYISSSFLGAKLKLDALPNARGDFAPHLRNYTAEYTQTWTLTPFVDAQAGNQTTWTMQPDWIAIGSAGGYFSVYNDTLEPYLAGPVPGGEDESAVRLQRWSVVLEGMTIDDPTFSATHLPALATEPAVVPVTDPTVTSTATVTSSPNAGNSTGDDNNSSSTSHLTGPLIAAAVVPTTFFAFFVAAFCLFICMRRRKLRKLNENDPYSHNTSGSRTRAHSSAVMSEIVDSFVEDPVDRWKRGNTKKPQGLTSLSLLSSNLSASLWSFRNVHESNTTVIANPLSAPPRPRTNHGDENGHANDTVTAPLSLPTRTQKENRPSVQETEVLPSPLNLWKSELRNTSKYSNEPNVHEAEVPPSSFSPRRP